MNAADHIDARIKACREAMERMRAQLSKLEHALPAASRWTGEVRHLMIDLNSQLQLIKVDMAVDVMTGQAEGRTPQEAVGAMELFAGMAPPQLGIVRPPPHRVEPFPAHAVAPPGEDCWRTLRRAGDDTRQGTEDNDANVSIVEAGNGTGVGRA